MLFCIIFHIGIHLIKIRLNTYPLNYVVGIYGENFQNPVFCVLKNTFHCSYVSSVYSGTSHCSYLTITLYLSMINTSLFLLLTINFPQHLVNIDIFSIFMIATQK